VGDALNVEYVLTVD